MLKGRATQAQHNQAQHNGGALPGPARIRFRWPSRASTARIAGMAALAKTPVFMSVEEFLRWEPGDGRAWQLVDGEPHAMAPPSLVHGILQAELGGVIRNHLRERKSPCRLLVTPGVVPHMLSSHNVRIPDLAVTCSPLPLQGATLTDPVLVVEILSPGNQAETWANVWAYTSIPSVREVVVLRTVSVGADVLRRGAGGAWPSEPAEVMGGDLVLDSIGLHTSLMDLYEGTPLYRPQV